MAVNGVFASNSLFFDNHFSNFFSKKSEQFWSHKNLTQFSQHLIHKLLDEVSSEMTNRCSDSSDRLRKDHCQQWELFRLIVSLPVIDPNAVVLTVVFRCTQGEGQ